MLYVVGRSLLAQKRCVSLLFPVLLCSVSVCVCVCVLVDHMQTERTERVIEQWTCCEVMTRVARPGHGHDRAGAKSVRRRRKIMFWSISSTSGDGDDRRQWLTRSAAITACRGITGSRRAVLATAAGVGVTRLLFSVCKLCHYATSCDGCSNFVGGNAAGPCSASRNE